MKKANYVVVAIIAVISIAIIVVSAGYPKAEAYGTGAPGPGLWPICVSVIMLLMSLILFIKTLLGKTEHEEGPENKFDLFSTDHLRVYVAMIVLVAYVVVLKPLGFLLPTVLMMTLFIYWFSKEKDPAYEAKKAKSRLEKKVFDVFDVTDGLKQSRPLWLCAVISLVATFVVYFAFKLGLNVPMNFGLLYI